MATKTLTLVIELDDTDAISEDAFQAWGDDIVNAVNDLAYVADVTWGERE